MFNKQLFDNNFNKNLSRLGRVEAMTKEILKNLSREVLVAVHETGDIGYVNKVINVLTPVNRKVFVLFATEFTGFNYDETAKQFGKKNKNKYDACHASAMDALNDPHFNVWSWSERNVDVERKPLDLSKVTAFIKSALKKADKDGIKQSDVIKAIFQGGIDIDSLIVVLGDMDGIDLTVTGDAE